MKTMMRVLTTVFAAGAIATGVAPVAQAATAPSPAVPAAIAISSTHNPCTDEYCALPGPAPRKKKVCEHVLIHNSGVPGDPDYPYGQHYELRCHFPQKDYAPRTRPGFPR